MRVLSTACWSAVVLACWVVAAADFNAGGSADWSARVWQLEDGLPDNSVTGVVQSPDGYLWVATQGGLARFDGLQFEEIELPLPARRAAPMIRVMASGPDDHLWLALEGGTIVELGRGVTNVYTAAQGVPTFRPLAVAQDRAGAVWLGYANGTAVRILGGQVRVFSGRDGLPGIGECLLASDGERQLWFAKAGWVGVFRDEQFVRLQRLPATLVHIGRARAGGLWICAGTELFKYREGSELERAGKLPVREAGVDATVLFEDRGGALWIGTSAGGLFRRESNGTVARVGVSHDEVRCLANDREGNLWVGTGGGGLNRLRLRVLELGGLPSGASFQPVRSLCEDAAGRLWAATQAGVLARCEQGLWRALSTNDGWTGAVASSVASDGQGGVWIGTLRGGLHHWQAGRFRAWSRADGLAGEGVHALMLDRTGALWIGWEWPTCLQRWHEGQGVTYAQPPGSRPIRALAEDAAGQIWLGTWDGSLLRVEGQRLVDETRRRLLPAHAIRCLYAGEDGSLWIGYAGCGVGRLRGGQFRAIGTAQGLANDNICGIAADGKGGLWFSSDHGLFQVRERELVEVAEGRAARVQSVVFGRDEGLPILQGYYDYWPNAVRRANGQLLFGTRKGVAVVTPEHVQLNRIPPPAVITRVVVDEQVWPVTGEARLELGPNHRRIDVNFTAPSFVAAEHLRFRHRLVGLDEDWVNSGAHRVASYSRLPAGRYEFQVSACNNAGVWSESGAAVKLVVRPFFWQTAWFKALLVFGLALAAGAAVALPLRVRHGRRLAQLKQQHALEQERARVAHDLHDDLGAGLAQIGLIGSLAQRPASSPERVRQHLREITDKSRELVAVLDEIVWAVSPKHDSTASLSTYFCEYAQEFLRPAQIACRLDVAPHQPVRPLSSSRRHQLFLAFKEALTNVVRHAHATEVCIRIDSDAQELRVTVEDNGQGLPAKAAGPGADGLGNMAERLARMGGRCEFASRPGGGTAVCLRLPADRSGRGVEL